MNRERTLISKILEAFEATVQTRIELEGFKTLQAAETQAIPRRLEKLRLETEYVERREREAQEGYRMLNEELN
jgi:pre-mRNA-splicing factor CDC5/CEF1